MKNICKLIFLFFLISCSSTTRTALNIKKSSSSKNLNLNGSFINGNSKLYLYKNNLVVRFLVGSNLDINFLKNQSYPDGYGWYFIENDIITIQYYIKAEGSPYVVIEHIGKIKDSNRFVIEYTRQFSYSLFGNSNIKKDKIKTECILQLEVKPDSLNPWVPIDSISYESAIKQKVWRNRFNGL